MTLADRLRERTPLGWGQRFFWRHLTTSGMGYDDLIDTVLERYARRYGDVGEPLARELQFRLVNKYCVAKHQVLKSLQGVTVNEYPRHKARLKGERIRSVERIRSQLAQKWASPDGDYCKLPCDGVYVYLERCCFCQTVCGYQTVRSTGHPRRPTEEVQSFEGVRFSSVNGVVTCKDKRCRAIAAYSTKLNPGGMRPEKRMINLLKELGKHYGNNTYYRGLAKHFVRHPGSTAERAH